MMAVIAAAFVAYHLLWLVRSRFAAALAATFLLFSLSTRTVALTYLDLAGPVYSSQLDRTVGGGNALPLFAAVVMVLVASLAFAFRPGAVRQWMPTAEPPSRRNSDASRRVFVLFGVGVLLVYADMLVRGPIPLFAGIDRLQYNAMAGILHGTLLDYGFLVAAALGYMFVRPRVRGREFDFRFFGLALTILLYFALTGHRFSAFYSFTSFFVVPLAVIPALAGVGKLPPAPARFGLKAFACSPHGLAVGAVTAIAAVGFLIVNSVTRVRGYQDPTEFLQQRILVQPVELWWVTWDEVASGVRWAFDDVWNRLFVNPIVPNRNSSIQWLMEKTLGYDRASELLGNGQQYAGGYPEVFFDLLGPWFAPIAIAVFLVPTVLLLRLVVRATAEGRVLTMLAGVFVYYGFTLLYIGGMLNFLSTWTYWAKIGFLVVAYLLEHKPAGIAAGLQTPRVVGVGGPNPLSGGGLS